MSPQAILAPDDFALLRAYEPILRFNRGELFYPMAVDSYLAECDVLAGPGERHRRVLVPHGEVTPEGLATAAAGHGESLYLRFVQEPLGRLELARWQLRPNRTVLRTPGRLARVGLFARLVDAGFTASLLARGTVPGGTAAAASVKYEAIRARDDRYVYHARVLRQDGWVALHYIFFYAMNDWRSTFAGANDHEADWEQLFVFLDDAPDGPVPAWVACAAHDYTGDDLRRRWDDPTLAKDGTHPIINPGGGSHAAYFEEGDYLTAAPIPGISRLRGPLAVLRGFWRDTLRQPDPGDLAAKLEGSLNVGFIDYGRGNGLTIGPGGDAAWTPAPIDDSVDWVDGYRGLFGLDTYDRFAGERAPAGPKYNRNGSVRQTWHDPLGWSGLDKVAPPHRAPHVLEDRIAALAAEAAALDVEIETAGAALRTQALEVRALGDEPALAGLHARGVAGLAEAETAQAAHRRRRVDLAETARAAREELGRLRAGNRGDPRSHLRHEHHPIPPEETRYGRLVELWSAVSVSLVLVGTIALVFFQVVAPWTAVIIVVAAYSFVEAAFRRRLTLLLLRLTLILAVIGALVLAATYTSEAVVVALVVLAGIILVDNVRELRGG
ncbi:MAG TPA: hypothetical protein VER83_01780 [Candidatus Nanopelagicales bacterium]|nr:hypothetical protein [Candidatus Nanopelagicales bacterium]